MHPNYLLGIGVNNEISVPYLSVYEGANAFGFYQGNSIYKEYKNDFDGTNNFGEQLAEDTYFYILKTPGDKTYKGYVEIKRK